VRFRTPARLDDELLVTCLMREVKGASVVFDQEVRARVTGECHSSAEVRVAYIERDNHRPKRIPRELVERMRGAELAAEPAPR
jgi:acyl-CoA thioester hydrolase